MSKNTKQTSDKTASQAAKTLRDPSASARDKSIAASALSQHGTGKETGKAMERTAAAALASGKTSPAVRKLAASVTSQSNKKR